MKEISLATLISVFTEMMGFWFWVLIAFSVIGLIAILFVLVKERGLKATRFVSSELVGLLSGFVAIWIALTVTQSSLADIGGPIDWVLMVVIYVLGAIGGTIGAYVVQGLFSSTSKGDSPAA
ncbi:MAG: DUF5368 domain-containing protein [Hyphomicrobiaceae bacterium]|nr:DUF5368 domain-containing protein [Hyphomicrobiaceae bacterium]